MYVVNSKLCMISNLTGNTIFSLSCHYGSNTVSRPARSSNLEIIDPTCVLRNRSRVLLQPTSLLCRLCRYWDLSPRPRRNIFVPQHIWLGDYRFGYGCRCFFYLYFYFWWWQTWGMVLVLLLSDARNGGIVYFRHAHETSPDGLGGLCSSLRLCCHLFGYLCYLQLGAEFISSLDWPFGWCVGEEIRQGVVREGRITYRCICASMNALSGKPFWNRKRGHHDIDLFKKYWIMVYFGRTFDA